MKPFIALIILSFLMMNKGYSQQACLTCMPPDVLSL